MRPDEQVEPDALYVCIAGFVTVHPDDPTRHFGCPEGKRLLGEDPRVSYRPQYFELDPVWEANRRLQRSQQPAAAVDATSTDVPVPVPEASGGRTRQPRGHPRYTEQSFDRRYAAAVDAAGGSTDNRDVAPHFRGLNRGSDVEPLIGVEPATLARLRQKRARGEMPRE